jgi:hypothetical protein
MQAWKTVLASTVLSAALTLTMVRHNSNVFERVGGNPPTAHKIDSRQVVAAHTDPIPPAEAVTDGRTSGSEQGWGRFRTVDW